MSIDRPGVKKCERPAASIHSTTWMAPSALVPYDFAQLMEGAKEVKCSQFADVVIAKM